MAFYGAFDENRFTVRVTELPAFVEKRGSGTGLAIVDPMTGKLMNTRCLNFDQIKDLFLKFYEACLRVREEIGEWCRGITAGQLEEWRRE
jgi:hypothetical protein